MVPMARVPPSENTARVFTLFRKRNKLLLHGFRFGKSHILTSYSSNKPTVRSGFSSHLRKYLIIFLGTWPLFSGCRSAGDDDSNTRSPEEQLVSKRIPSDTRESSPSDPSELHPAERAFLEARLDTAIDLLNKRRRDSTDGLILAYSLFLRGDDADSQKAFSTAMKVPRYKDSSLFEGLLGALTGKLSEAIEHLQPKPKQAHRFFARVLLVELLTLAERFDEAEPLVDALIKDFPEETIVHHTKGHLEAARESWSAALAAYTHADALGKNNPDVCDGLVQAHIGLKDFTAARALLDSCQPRFPQYAELLYQRIRMETLIGESSDEALHSLVSEYRKRSKRQDRIKEFNSSKPK